MNIKQLVLGSALIAIIGSNASTMAQPVDSRSTSMTQDVIAYISIEKSNGTWVVKAISETKPERSKGKEIITFPGWMPAFDNNGECDFIGRYAGKGFHKGGAKIYQCKVNSTLGYTAGTSRLTSFVDTDFFGLGGFSRYSLDIDTQRKVIADISPDTRIKDLVVQLKADNQVVSYRSAYKAAQTEADLVKFIDQYETNDTDGLVVQAKEKLANLREQKLNQQEAIRAQQLKQQETNRIMALERSQRNEKWRKNLRSGDDTFCGPIIEVRGSMVLIAVRAQLPGYGNTAWLKLTELYPPEAGCRNTNGSLATAE